MKNLNDYLTQNIHGKRVLISGGTTGIGRATAVLLAAQGAQIIIFGRHQAQIDETIDEITAMGSGTECFGICADVSNAGDISEIFDLVERRFKGLDILINNAALPYGGIMEGSYEDWQYIINTNLLGYMACTNEAVKRMKDQQDGHIINIGSISAEERGKNSSVYVATKAGVRGFNEALRKEVNEMGIKVTLIEPGRVGSDMIEENSQQQDEKIQSMEMLKAEDIAMSILYCLSQPKRSDIIFLQIRPHLQIM